MNIKEITYFNEGEVYRESEPPMQGNNRVHNSHFIGSRTDGSGKFVMSNYFNLSYPLPMASFNWISQKKYLEDDVVKVKKYYKSEWYAKQKGETDWMDVPEGIDVYPSIGNIICIGIMGNEVDIFFDMVNVSQMQEVAEYYNLPTPLKADEAFVGGKHRWNLYYLQNGDATIKNVNMAAIKFIDSRPRYFKYYKYVPR